MIIQSIAFYILSAVTIGSAFMVIASRNPVHSVLFLILAFVNSAGLFVLMGAEFIGLMLIVVYVGAVAVLFLFVVMMLDINFVELRQGFLQYLPVGALVGAILLVELFLVIGAWAYSPDVPAVSRLPIPAFTEVTNAHAIGQVMYTYFIYAFQVAGLILLVAMVGAIVLTHRARVGVRKQNIAAQNARLRSEAVSLKKVEPGQGI
ncbi:NADH-quinone oxidoreductase subunit J [Marinibaculum pumilum]|uniref:NADH-quinone oxidoreductase subunit J n=1 Tax=Marinibaculum pumilum TaxID=1766165 RepID=A0ABV7KUE7_9PROT